MPINKNQRMRRHVLHCPQLNEPFAGTTSAVAAVYHRCGCLLVTGHIRVEELLLRPTIAK
jgi:hypothetical protein